MKKLFLITCIAIISLFSCKEQKMMEAEVVDNKLDLEIEDPYVLIGEKNYLMGYAPINTDNDINVVVEIPTGSIDKWEVNKKTGNMNWEFRNDEPRRIKYLGYPGNYGMIPKTILTKELGGDGDPIDVLVLGPPVERGAVIKAKLIGILKLLDNGEQDDKLIAVMEGTVFYKVNSLDELNLQFNGVTKIVETFFSNYKGKGEMESLGFKDEKEAEKMLNYAIAEYEK